MLNNKEEGNIPKMNNKSSKDSENAKHSNTSNVITYYSAFFS